MTYEANTGVALALGDLHNAKGNRDIEPHHRPSLLRNCRLIFQETFPILYNQTRFDISFDSCWYQSNRPLETHLLPKYQLQLTSGRSQITHGLTQVVLARVKHVRVFMNDTRLSTYIWRMHILSTCLSHGMGLESLRLLSAIPMAELDDIWSTAEILYFDSYKDTVVLELVDCDVTEEDKAVFKRIQNLLGRVLSVSMKRHTPNDL
ncbi:uncharacterized protein M437DRAFT_70343 [Aureobasidium melanogenum CBS 110374]|uniref:Uncharacterized protein n=1 Tax=Aureobasidium melanogenum (strain CBS 110374) TaxID=1043003 RepID=A0A074VCD2_AURM1|nr:uncharacterized protein M437DRAFT_70343 [Aureobasidium melanogenum CBS 110374]KEQ58008.1 hypothetical protein M437DRAFT_70343 [Aureobasidium melanogenum CBS 110374]